jgi:hypothetical protein
MAEGKSGVAIRAFLLTALLLVSHSTPLLAAVNDAFAAATELSGGSGRVTGSNITATTEAGEPNHAGMSGGKTVWWQWLSPVTGDITFDTIGSTFDTLLVVYVGSAVANLTEVMASDDGGGQGSSRVTFLARKGVRYRIVVDGYRGEAGSIVLTYASWRSRGDVYPDAMVTLADAVTGLQILTGMDPQALNPAADVDGNRRLGMTEVLYTLYFLAGFGERTPAFPLDMPLPAGALFDHQWYLDQRPDVAGHEYFGERPLLHYWYHGRFEGSYPYPLDGHPVDPWRKAFPEPADFEYEKVILEPQPETEYAKLNGAISPSDCVRWPFDKSKWALFLIGSEGPRPYPWTDGGPAYRRLFLMLLDEDYTITRFERIWEWVTYGNPESGVFSGSASIDPDGLKFFYGAVSADSATNQSVWSDIRAIVTTDGETWQAAGANEGLRRSAAEGLFGAHDELFPIHKTGPWLWAIVKDGASVYWRLGQWNMNTDEEQTLINSGVAGAGATRWKGAEALLWWDFSDTSWLRLYGSGTQRVYDFHPQRESAWFYDVDRDLWLMFYRQSDDGETIHLKVY